MAAAVSSVVALSISAKVGSPLGKLSSSLDQVSVIKSLLKKSPAGDAEHPVFILFEHFISRDRYFFTVDQCIRSSVQSIVLVLIVRGASNVARASKSLTSMK